MDPMEANSSPIKQPDLVFIHTNSQSSANSADNRLAIRSKAGQFKHALTNYATPNTEPWKPFHRITMRKPARRTKISQTKQRRGVSNVSARNILHIDNAEAPIRDYMKRLVEIFNSRIEYIGGSSFDPFNSIPFPGLPESTLSNSLFIFLGEFIPLMMARPVGISFDAETYDLFSLVKQDRACLASCIFIALCNKRARERQSGVQDTSVTHRLKHQAIFCQYEATRLLKEEVQKQNNLSDVNLMTMIFLGCASWDSEVSTDRPAFIPAMQDLSLLDSMIGIPPERHHVDSCFEYVHHHGGITRFGMNFMRAGLSYASVVDATRQSARPVFPHYPFTACNEPHTLQARFRFSDFDVEEQLGQYETAGLSRPLLDTFYAVRLYEAMLRQHMQGTLEKSISTNEFADLRNLVQHHVLSIPPKPYCASWKDSQYEACRLALHLYSIGVVFPMTLSSAPWERLTKDLLNVLSQDEYSVFRAANARHPWASGMLAWVCMVGGIAASATPLYEDFVSILRQWFCVKYGDLNFESLKSLILSDILWFEYSCDLEGEALWNNALNLMNETTENVSPDM